MQTKYDVIDLKAAIAKLEYQKANEWVELKEQIFIISENLKPVNLIKNTFRELVASKDFKADLLNTTLGLTAGYISKKVVVGSTHNPLKQLLGNVLQVGITSAVARSPISIGLTAANFVSRFFKKKA